jgi:hypothetical protein
MRASAAAAAAAAAKTRQNPLHRKASMGQEYSRLSIGAGLTEQSTVAPECQCNTAKSNTKYQSLSTRYQDHFRLLSPASSPVKMSKPAHRLYERPPYH